jgi:hypothetical protein
MSRTLDFLLGALMATAALAFALILVITGTHKPHLPPEDDDPPKPPNP